MTPPEGVAFDKRWATLSRPLLDGGQGKVIDNTEQQTKQGETKQGEKEQGETK